MSSTESFDALALQGQSYERIKLDLTPARWIWFPSARTLPNTFILFRRELNLAVRPRRVTGWLTADSRYLLTVNGERVQWGPAPSDPRWLEADPVDLTHYLGAGLNVLGVEVLYYGHGDGTWATGKPGLLCKLEIEYTDGTQEELISDDSWLSFLDRAHRPGQYKRWYLRALQEEFDARLHPQGWATRDFTPDASWLPAMLLDGSATLPPATNGYRDYLTDMRAQSSSAGMLARQIPLTREKFVPALRLQGSGQVQWRRNPNDWFEFRTPNSFTLTEDAEPPTHWTFPATPDSDQGIFATFEFSEQIVGWPVFTIEAPEGTVIELMTQESHDPEKTTWLDNHFFSWSRFTCIEGLNTFSPFDFESLRWLQLHIHHASRPVTLYQVGVRRRLYPWPDHAGISCNEPALQRLFEANLNTMYNSAQETIVDGMGRERQQYSGDGGHQLYAIRYSSGDREISRRFLRTYSEGLTYEGYFLDCWPGTDRLVRIAQRTLDLTPWGPLLDHSIGFTFDCWHYYLESGDLEALHIPYARLVRFAHYLLSLRQADKLLPVENLGVPVVWVDHEAYVQQKHKQCAFNLYAAAMLQHALSPMAHALGDTEHAAYFQEEGARLLHATVQRYWSKEQGCFVNNLPWLQEEGEIHLCDRSLATSILYQQCPDNNIARAARVLADCPPELGLSFPANGGWRYWALARVGRIDIVLQEFRNRWATLDSVLLNNTLQEAWDVESDSISQWSHCGVVPLYVLYMDIAGIRAKTPGFAQYQVRPQLGDLEQLELTLFIAHGPVHFTAHSEAGGHRITLQLPAGGEAELITPKGAEVDLPLLREDLSQNLHYWRLSPEQTHSFWLPASSGKND
ncbi:alpha-L-rhamnosidase-related protein [Tengunoibacter tsumagoiensis]|uniref:Alpha-L-rhamnosidase n=1 Tax=Tengunoibacter tsumagoiensis TaxID=2014871 RepID=A0A402A6K6_9CHLR|nr:alpha-L-rhamnosidase N-terminal domain-containing protein [Tengunoibacter tsumagoiensis]GCE14777.1 hypothetical protein KTT_46360 [Tengunoibacter tsumagoiensis]